MSLHSSLNTSLRMIDNATSPAEGGPAWMRTLGFLILLVWTALLVGPTEMITSDDPAYRGMSMILDDRGWLVVTVGLLALTFLAIVRDGTQLAVASLGCLACFELVVWFLIIVEAPSRVIAWMHLAVGVMTTAAFVRRIMLSVTTEQLDRLEAEARARRQNGA